MSRRHGLAVGLTVFTVVTIWASIPLLAQESRSGDDRIIHRYFDASEWFDSSGATSTRPGEPPRAAERSGAQPPARVSGDAPGLWLSPGGDEWIWTAQGPVGPNGVAAPHGELGSGGATALDNQTDRVDELDYQTSFEPSVVPFKRGVAQNRVRRSGGGDYAVYLDSGAYTAVNVGGALGDDEDHFWGSFLMRMDEDERHPIASVAPGQRVLSIETEPRIGVVVERDGADNFYVSGDFEGLVRINMEIAVERRYFDGAVDRAVGWDAFTAGIGIEDSEILSRAAAVLELIGVDRQTMTPATALDRLVEYHREFVARSYPEALGGDRYIEISEQRLGVCRHRSLTFMISARALGFRTRYVYNEAHAFIEVDWPGQGWRRIDLGGAADVFNHHNRGTGEIHDGLWDYEFPRPAAYEEEMTAITSDGSGSSGSDTAQGETAAADQIQRESSGSDQDFSTLDPADLDEVVEPSVGQEQPAVRQVELLEADGEVYRGQSLAIRGRVDGITEITKVEVFLVPSGARNLTQGLSLGKAETDDFGFFDGEWTVPLEVSLGRWQLQGRVADEE